MASQSLLHKRVRLDPSASPSPPPISDAQRIVEEAQKGDTRLPISWQVAEHIAGHDEPTADVNDEEDEDHCVICLQHIRDRTVLPCAHDRLCFDCIFVWCQQSRKCPLCNAPIGPFLIHNFRSKYDYSKYYLPPLRTSSPTSAPIPDSLLGLAPGTTSRSRGRARGQTSRWGMRRRIRSTSRERRESADELELAIERRRWVYRHGLYAKHVASNPYTRYRPAPTPGQIAASPDLISRATIFVRRELRVWVNLDVETLDLRSESAVKLLAEFLDMDTPYYIGDPEEPSTGRFPNAERFSHELYSYLRSPFRDLAAYDASVQYDTPPHVPLVTLRDPGERHRWDVDPSTQAVPSPRLSRCSSSHSRHSHSPRDPHPRSPSPAGARSHRESWKRPSIRPRSTPDLRRISNGNTRASNVSSSDAKGKGKVPLASTVEPSRYDDPLPHTHSADRPGRDVGCADRSAAQSTNLVPPIPRDFPHSTSHSSDIVRREKARSDHSDSPSTSPDLKGDTGPVTGGIIRGELGLLEDGQDVKKVDDRSETIDGSWGISIKGQARRLSQLRERMPLDSSDSYRELRLVEASSTQSTVPRKRSWNSSSLDMLRTHLGDSSPRQNRIGVTANGMTKDISPGEPQKSTIELGTPSDQILPANSTTALPRPGPLSRRSARDIMARTRARLAKLRMESPQTPVAKMISDTPFISPAGEVTGVSASTADLRSRLMERLEEEKRQATGQHSSQGKQSTLGLPNSDMQGPDVGTTESNGSTGISSQAQQAVIKLRVQALLRVRLAAEKRRADVSLDQDSAGLREEALKARLLSRRTS